MLQSHQELIGQSVAKPYLDEFRENANMFFYCANSLVSCSNHKLEAYKLYVHLTHDIRSALNRVLNVYYDKDIKGTNEEVDIDVCIQRLKKWLVDLVLTLELLGPNDEWSDVLNETIMPKLHRKVTAFRRLITTTELKVSNKNI